MFNHRSRSYVFLAVILVGVGLAAVGTTLARQEDAPTCDLDALLEHQQEHAARLATLAGDLETDPDAALQELYIAGIAYQSLAVQCGFLNIVEAQTLHDSEHGLAARGEPDAEIVALAVSVGDPANGEALFNSFQNEVGFACATCHRVDSAERLVGPGLWNVGNPEHDPSEHAMGGMDMGGGEETPEAEHAMGGMDMGHEETDPVDYIRTSIVDPSTFVVPGFPDNLMPKTYGDLFTEEEIDDLVAYLLTLQER